LPERAYPHGGPLLAVRARQVRRLLHAVRRDAIARVGVHLERRLRAVGPRHVERRRLGVPEADVERATLLREEAALVGLAHDGRFLAARGGRHGRAERGRALVDDLELDGAAAVDGVLVEVVLVPVVRDVAGLVEVALVHIRNLLGRGTYKSTTVWAVPDR